MKPKTVEEFERQYAVRSGVTVGWLRREGLYGASCNCGDSSCQGFQMTRSCCRRGECGTVASNSDVGTCSRGRD